MVTTSDQNLKRFFLISLGAHGALFLTLILKSVLIPSQPKIYIPSLRVDLVGLPRNKINEVIKLPSAPEKVPEKTAEKEPVKEAEKPKIETKPEIKEKPEDKNDEMGIKKKKLSPKEIKAQEKLKNALARVKALERMRTLEAAEPIAGNQVSKGSALSGEAKTSLETTYFDVVLERVRTNWELPKWLQDQNLSAKVILFLDQTGAIRHFQLTQSSGNTQFDGEVRRALQASGPFPPPPSEIASDLSHEGILLGFPL